MLIKTTWVVDAQFLLVLSLFADPSNELTRCITDDDCPTNGGCFKDECARCLCSKGSHVVNFFDGNTLHHICEELPPVTPPVFGRCSNDKWRAIPCPRGSHCDVTSGRCLCDLGLVPHADNTLCRLTMYGEQCSAQVPCARELGFRCKAGVCRCLASFHRPTAWTRFVLRRWDYSKVVGDKQNCVVRAVGEKCRREEHCAAVQGSGAVCSQCGLCRCRVSGHVPDILGTTCGPARGLGDACSVHAEDVCDGTQGLQCGDVCDLYELHQVTTKTCTCSQMHDRQAGDCVPKTIGSSCSTDLDCYLLTNGFGYCDGGGSCRADASVPRYTPHLVNITCRQWKQMQASSGGETTHYASTQIPKARTADAGDSGEKTQSENDHYDHASYNDITNSTLIESRRPPGETLTPGIEPELNIAAGSTPGFIERNKPGERSVHVEINIPPNVASSRERGSGTSGGAIWRRDIPVTALVLLTVTAMNVPRMF